MKVRLSLNARFQGRRPLTVPPPTWRLALLALSLCSFLGLQAQTPQAGYTAIPLTDLSAFQSTAGNWTVVGSVTTHPKKAGQFTTTSGTGILVNQPTDKAKANIMTKQEFGDVDLSLDYMMAEGSNSGVYLMGRYEIQLLDSWGKPNMTYQDNGAIYARWDEATQHGYEGHAPGINVSRAPGLWQHLEISFQAPRFEGGKKVANARILSLSLNGTVLHENVELTGPTRGPAFPEEAATGPLFIQGDHGAVAFRNLAYKAFTQDKIALSNLKYRLYEGAFQKPEELSSKAASQEGTLNELTWRGASGANEYAYQITGTMQIPAAGQYIFELNTGTRNQMMIGNKRIPDGTPVQLQAGAQQFEILTLKDFSWQGQQLGLMVSGPGMRRQPLHASGSMPLNDPTSPILLPVQGEPKVFRSFIDFKQDATTPERRIPHAISVGDPSGVHYTFDADNGALVQVWRGEFLDATPMWNSRGDGSADPMGSILPLNDAPALAVLTTTNAEWPTTEPEGTYRMRGYKLDAQGYPTFRYTIHGLNVQDRIVPAEGGKKLVREIRLENPASTGLYFRVANGTGIAKQRDGAYTINDQQYKVKLLEGPTPTVRNGNELVVPMAQMRAGQALRYEIIW
ncbi:DUF1080 domain-containing protein [Catalinimonas alkaloidigena]|nr:DUF1080 domain-containing protein [Catalinimonas alkaloidigena]